MGQRIGSLIGCIGGVIFVLINAGGLGSPLSTVLRVVGVVLFAFTVWYAVVRVRHEPASSPPSPEALRVYRICVIAMVIAIPVGAQVLVRAFDRPDLTPVWVVFVVGAHFVPFARAFEVPLFARLAWALIAVAIIGGVATAAGTSVGAPWTGVVAGFVLLAFAALGARQRRVVAQPA